MPLDLDVFIDLTGSSRSEGEVRAVVERWQRPECLGSLSGQVRAILPRSAGASALRSSAPHWCFSEDVGPVAGLDAALRAAGQRGVGVLILTGAVDVTCEAIGALHQRLRRDPMFGFAIPRTGCADRCCIARLADHGAGAAGWMPRRVLSDLPEAEIFVETVSPCVLVAPQIVGNFGPLDSRFEALPAALLHYMATARRCGFRTVLCNRAVIGGENLSCGSRDIAPVPAFSETDRTRLLEKIPDFDRSWKEFRAAGWQRFEQLCAAGPDGPPSLLFDIRNVGPLHNGTTRAVLGLVSAFRERSRAWDVALLVDPLGAAFHDFPRVYAGWPVHSTPPAKAFTLAFRPSQPWHIQEMADLHHAALINAYTVLDTISWDIAYWAPPHLEGVWQFLADHANGLVYDSDFTRRRFVERFPSGRSIPNTVTHFSFDPREYTDVTAKPGARQFALVVGNHLDHKDVRQTVATLASAFPYQPITALGPADATSPFITARQSGSLSESEIQGMYAGADYVVYPSFYEGFGFPIVTALARGRTVLARRSALLDELAEHCDGRGRLIAFDTREHLVELLGRLRDGEAVPEIPVGRAAAGAPARTWRDVADETHQFLFGLIADDARRHWIARERALSQLMSFRG
jgi:glycosyltransferase involved in cell wall biosynthesis